MSEDPYDDYGGDPFKKPATAEEITKSVNETFALLGGKSSWSSGVPLDPKLYPIFIDPKTE